MLSAKDVAVVYETLLSFPGMNDSVKVVLQIPRKQLLLLSKAIEIGLQVKDEGNQAGLLGMIDPTTLDQLQEVSKNLLTLAGLTDISEKLKALQLTKEK